MPNEPPPPQPLSASIFKNVVVRRVLFATGCLCVVLGVIGLILPMMPGTIFLIIAAWCFARSSPRFETWLLTHRYLGPTVVRWRETGAIPPIAKVFALLSFVGSWLGSWYLGAPIYVLWGLAFLFAGLAVFMVTRPNS